MFFIGVFNFGRLSSFFNQSPKPVDDSNKPTEGLATPLSILAHLLESLHLRKNNLTQTAPSSLFNNLILTQLKKWLPSLPTLSFFFQEFSNSLEHLKVLLNFLCLSTQVLMS